MENYGTRLKAILNAKGIKQVELADAVGSNPKNISSYIAGRSEPTLETANRIAKYLDVPIDYFLGNISLEEAVAGVGVSAVLGELKKYLSGDVYDLVELAVMLKNGDMCRIISILKKLTADGVAEVLKQAEKEYLIDIYKK